MYFKYVVFFVLQVLVLSSARNVDSIEKKYQDWVFEKYTNTLKERCDAQGGEGAGDKLVENLKEARTCVESELDFEYAEEEIATAWATGELDSFFKQWCGKAPEIKKCMGKIFDGLQHCINDANFNKVKSQFEKLIDFTCEKDGDKIALFVSEGGFECMMYKKPEITACLKSAKEFEGGLQLFVRTDDKEFTDEMCQVEKEVKDCVIKALEECKNKTTANMVDALYNHMKSDSKCPK